MTLSGDTIAAIATAPGRGAVAIVRLSGPDAFAIASRLTGGKTLRHAHAVFCRFALDGGPVLDEGICLAFEGPRSYTGEDVVEFQTHGGAVAPGRVLEALFSLGARLARRGEFTERAFLNGKMTFSQAAAVIDVVDAKTSRAADRALSDLAGTSGVLSAARDAYERLVDASAFIEHSLDVEEGELPDGFYAEAAEKIRSALDKMSAAVRLAGERRLLSAGALVVLAGPPNAGKSSLMNALTGTDRAIVSPEPGTTRDSVESWLDIGGWPVRLADTAGIRHTGRGMCDIEVEGVRRSEALVARADAVVFLCPGGEPCGDAAPPRDAILVSSKCDICRGKTLNVSSATGEGVEELKLAIAEKLEKRAEECAGETGHLTSERETAALVEARAMVESALDKLDDPVLAANDLRRAAGRLGTELGSDWSSDMLDRLFSRFCVGK